MLLVSVKSQKPYEYASCYSVYFVDRFLGSHTIDPRIPRNTLSNTKGVDFDFTGKTKILTETGLNQ